MKKRILLLLPLLAVLFFSCKKESTNDKQSDTDSVVVAAETDNPKKLNDLIQWEGEYKGITPCDDCDGVETSIVLNFDQTFTQTTNYIGKGGPYESKGTFRFDETGAIAILHFEDNSEAKYLLGNGTISLLNEDGSMIEGEDYVLKK